MAVVFDQSIYLPLIASVAIVFVLQFILWNWGVGRSLVGFFASVGLLPILQAVAIILMAAAGLGVAFVGLLMITTEDNDKEMQHYVLSMTILAPFAAFVILNGLRILGITAESTTTRALNALTNIGKNTTRYITAVMPTTTLPTLTIPTIVVPTFTVS